MSYEGYRDYQCAEGHLDSADVYMDEPKACQICGGRWEKIRSVDQTNGHDVGDWGEVEYRPQSKDYVKAGYWTATAHREKGEG